MITIFNRRELYSGFSMAECSRIGRILKAQGIAYIIRDHDMNPIKPGYYTLSAPMMQTESVVEYYLYVHKKDYEEALYYLEA